MSDITDERPIEIHLFSPVQAASHVELLTSICHYHRTAARLDWGHSVNFGRPWLAGSCCDHGLISLPYLDGPEIEELRRSGCDRMLRCLWLIPISPQEAHYKRDHGLEALETMFEAAQINYANPGRLSVV